MRNFGKRFNVLVIHDGIKIWLFGVFKYLEIIHAFWVCLEYDTAPHRLLSHESCLVEVFVHAHFVECVEHEDQKHVQELFLLQPSFLENIISNFAIKIPDEWYSVRIGLGDNESVDAKEFGNPFGRDIAADGAINKPAVSIKASLDFRRIVFFDLTSGRILGVQLLCAEELGD